MKKTIVSALLFWLIIPAWAQLKQFTLEEAMLKARTTLAPENLRQLQFINGSSDYVYIKNANGSDAVIWGNGKARSETPWLPLATLNNLLRQKNADTVKTMPAIQWYAPRKAFLLQKDKFITISYADAVNAAVEIKPINEMDGLLEFNPGYTHFALLRENNLYVSNFAQSRQVTTDGSANIVYAQSVHRDEFGINKGTFWSNNGKLLAFYRMDQSMVTDYPIIDWTKRPARNENIKYPMAGDPSHQVTVGIYNVETQKTIYLQTGEPKEQYLTNIAWSPDDRYVYIAVLNRQQNYMQLNQYDAATGSLIKTLFEEKDEKYVEPLEPILFMKNNPGQFIWQSNRDGWNHLYLYNADGSLAKQLTTGNWEVTEVKGFDEKGKKLFFMATGESPVTRNLYSVDVKSGKTERITTGEGTHTVQVSSDGSSIIDVMSNTATPRTINLTAIKTKQQQTLLTASNPLKEYALADINIFTIKGKSGDDLYCRLYKPVNQVPGKKYPVIVYWYGGPHAQLINNTWNGGTGDLWFQYLAQRGYVVFTADTRGSDNRGRAFEQSMFRKLGDVQMEDMLSSVDYLKQQPYVDATRIGLFGWSFGGFLTTDFMLNHPGVFKAAVAGGPVIDWKYYEIMYTERYMDSPQENPGGYAATNLTKQVTKLKDKLLLVHGLQDPVVVQQHSVNFVKACVEKGVQVDYMIYPGHEHNVLGKDRVHLYQKVTDYFFEHLNP